MIAKGVHSVFFLGIGGIGMSALARWFQQEGYAVAGYDKTPSPLTDALVEEGMEVIFADQVAAVPSPFRERPEEVLVVWTPAIPKDSVLLHFFQQGFLLKKRAEVLGMITKDQYLLLGGAFVEVSRKGSNCLLGRDYAELQQQPYPFWQVQRVTRRGGSR